MTLFSSSGINIHGSGDSGGKRSSTRWRLLGYNLLDIYCSTLFYKRGCIMSSTSHPGSEEYLLPKCSPSLTNSLFLALAPMYSGYVPSACTKAVPA